LFKSTTKTIKVEEDKKYKKIRNFPSALIIGEAKCGTGENKHYYLYIILLQTFMNVKFECS
jgi:hypothetical protein